MRLQASNASPDARWMELYLFTHRERASRQGAGGDGPRAADREYTIDEPSRAPVAFGLGSGGEHRVQRGDQLGGALPRRGGAGDHGCSLQRGAGDALAQLRLGELERLGVHEIELRYRDHGSVDAEDVDDLQVLLGLRLPAFVGGP